MATDYAKMVTSCTHGKSPSCTIACPFNLDVRSIVSRLQRGKVDSAWRLYRNTVMFPGIVSRLCTAPCHDVCERCSTDHSVNLKLIERSMDALTKKKDPVKLNVPVKNRHIVVVGAGLAGLACTMRLAERKYDVTLVEASDRIGGDLWNLLPQEQFLPEIQQQFEGRTYTLQLNQRVTSLDQLQPLQPDAVFVATGAGGCDFGLLDDAQGYPPLKVNGNVFFGGGIIGGDAVWAIRHGNDAANMIEMYLNTGRCLNLLTDYGDVRNRPDPALLVPTQPVQPADGQLYDKDELVAEASRCLRCDCDICMTRCPLMTHFGKSPIRIADNVRATVNPTDPLENRVATRLIASCDQCGICVDSCPYGVDTKALLMDARREMVRQGSMPSSFSAFWLEDMDEAMSDEASVVRMPPGFDECDYAFFPGCQLGASDPRYVAQTYELLRGLHPDTALMLTCCGAPAYWSGDEQLHQDTMQRLAQQWRNLGEPTMVCACPTCQQMLQDYLPGCHTVSLYAPQFMRPLLAQLRDAGRLPARMADTLWVFDPCTARFDAEAREGVRLVAAQLASGVADDPTDAACCGWGGQYMMANATMSSNQTQRVSDKSAAPVLTYCSNCRDTLFAKNGSAMHVLDLLLGINGPQRPAPTVTQRRSNRIALAQQLTADIWGETLQPEPARDWLLIDPQLAQTISDRWILESDVAQVIQHCERYGQKVVDSTDGSFFGHLQVGYITLWVNYRQEGDGWRVLDAYSHRMSIEEGRQWIPLQTNEA